MFTYGMIWLVKMCAAWNSHQVDLLLDILNSFISVCSIARAIEIGFLLASQNQPVRDQKLFP